MIDALIAGKLYGQATQRPSKNGGKPFVTAKVRAAGGGGESIFVNVIAFDDTPCNALMALGEGDSVCLSGALTPKVWTDREGQHHPALDMVAHQVLTAYHVSRKRNAVANDRPAPPRQYDGSDFAPDSRDFYPEQNQNRGL